MRIGLRRSHRSLGVAFMTILLSQACGNDKDDPDVITRDDLKAPGALNLIDLGNGDIQLQWQTANYEEDFEGYNIYGAKGSTAELGVENVDQIQLLDNNGEPIDNARQILANFSYSDNNPYALPNAEQVKDGVVSEETKLKFSALPYHKLRTATKEPNLPTCKPNVDSANPGVCKNLGSEKESTPAEEITSIGKISYTFPEKLEVGENYCFFVFAVQEEGEEISQSSSNVACITPKFKISQELTFAVGAYQKIGGTATINKLDQIRESCRGNANGCADVDITFEGNGTTQINASSAETFQFEVYQSGTSLNLVTGNNASILRLGYFANGFSDENFISQISSVPALTLEEQIQIKNPNGYSLEGQSIQLYPNQIYVLASGDQEATSVSSFYYDWFYFSEASCDGTNCTVKFDLFLSSQKDIRSR